MPDKKFYEGLSLTEQLLKFADHHLDPGTRHISADEARMLREASARLATGKRTAIALVAVIVIGTAAPRLRTLSRRLNRRHVGGHSNEAEQPPDAFPS